MHVRLLSSLEFTFLSTKYLYICVKNVIPIDTYFLKTLRFPDVTAALAFMMCRS